MSVQLAIVFVGYCSSWREETNIKSKIICTIKITEVIIAVLNPATTTLVIHLLSEGLLEYQLP